MFTRASELDEWPPVNQVHSMGLSSGAAAEIASLRLGGTAVQGATCANSMNFDRNVLNRWFGRVRDDAAPHGPSGVSTEAVCCKIDFAGSTMCTRSRALDSRYLLSLPQRSH